MRYHAAVNVLLGTDPEYIFSGFLAHVMMSGCDELNTVKLAIKMRICEYYMHRL